MYDGYYGYPDGYNITSDLSVIFDEKIRKFNPSGLVKVVFKNHPPQENLTDWSHRFLLTLFKLKIIPGVQFIIENLRHLCTQIYEGTQIIVELRAVLDRVLRCTSH
jgi:hypothetical protein